MPNPNQALLAEGMFARVQVAFSKPYTGLAVSDRAVVTNQGDKDLYVVNDKNVVEERPVELGRLDGPGPAAREGGDSSRASGSRFRTCSELMPGMKVKPVPTEMPLPPGK